MSEGGQRLNWASYHDKSLVNEESIVSPRIVSPLPPLLHLLLLLLVSLGPLPLGC